MSTLYLDFGEDTERAMSYYSGAGKHGGTLEDLLQSFPQTRAEEALDPALMQLPLTKLTIIAAKLGDGSVLVGRDGSQRVGVLTLPSRDHDGTTEETNMPPETSSDGDRPNAETLALFPRELSDRAAVEIVYKEHLSDIATYLKAGLSILVQCDKNIVPHVYPMIVQLAGRSAVLDTEMDSGGGASASGDAMEQLAAMAAGSAGLVGRLGELLMDLKEKETLVLAYLDLVCGGTDNMTQESRRLAEHVFRYPKASLLGFVDPTLSLPAILTTRFPIHTEIAGIDRERVLPNGDNVPTLALITLESERQRCEAFNPEGLFKHVSGFNPVQYRDAMRFISATAGNGAKKVTDGELISALQSFKKGSGQDVQLPDKSFDDIGGYVDLVNRLRQIAQLMAGRKMEGVPECMRHQLLPQGLLLHGRPGTGKTLLAKALANEMNATIQVVSGPEVMDMYVGESERKIRNLFSTARRNAPSVIIFDEFDAIATQRTEQTDGGNRAGNAVVAQLLTELDGFHEDSDVLVVATTNRIDIIDEALLRPSRFMPIEVPLPDPTARLSIAELHARAYRLHDVLPLEGVRLVAEYSEGLNGDEIRAVFQEAATALFLENRKIDLPLLGELVGRMRERREQRRRSHLETRGANHRNTARDTPSTPPPTSSSDPSGDSEE